MIEEKHSIRVEGIGITVDIYNGGTTHLITSSNLDYIYNKETVDKIRYFLMGGKKFNITIEKVE